MVRFTSSFLGSISITIPPSSIPTSTTLAVALIINFLLSHSNIVLWYFPYITKGVILPGIPRWLNDKESACQFRRHGFDPWVRKISWRRKWQPTPAFLPEKYHGQKSLVGFSPWSHKRVRHHLVTKPQQQRRRDKFSRWTCVPVWVVCGRGGVTGVQQNVFLSENLECEVMAGLRQSWYGLKDQI